MKMAAALHLTRLASRSCFNGALRSPMAALGERAWREGEEDVCSSVANFKRNV